MDNAFYNKVLKDNREGTEQHVWRTNLLVEMVGKNNVVLDVGCNNGHIGESLIKKRNTVYGFDIVEQNLKSAKRRGLEVKKFAIKRGEPFPYTTNFFDVVLMADIIEHIFDTDDLLRQCNRVLKKNGRLIISTPNIASLGRRIMLLFGVSPFLEYSLELSTNGLPSAGHVRYYTMSTLQNQLHYNGFRIEKAYRTNINLGFIRIPFLVNIFPSLCPTLFITAIKDNAMKKLYVP